MPTAITTPTITINNETVFIVPGSFSYTEGLGEQTVRVQSAGGGSVVPVYSQNVEMRKSTVKFSMVNEPNNIKKAREWKILGQGNAISATDVHTGFTKTFKLAVSTTNYDVPLGPDGVLELEFETQSAIGE